MDDRTRLRNVLQHILGRGLLLGLLFALSPVWVAYAQQGVIRGQVMDRDTREGLPGANIVVQGTTLGAATDIEGRYEIANVPAGTYTVSVSYVGYRSAQQQVSVAAGATVTLNFLLEPDVRGLEEIVVTGVASRTAKAIAPLAVSRINTADLEVVGQYSSITNLISGKVAGLQIINPSGNLGGGFRFFMRSGGGLYGTGQPVVYIDGVRVTNIEIGGFGVGGQQYSTLAGLNPEDIESIEVIKGPAGGALYGTSGQNGVILITTKRARRLANALQVDYRSTFGYNTQARKYDPDLYITADKANALFRRGPIQDHALAIQGTAGWTRYYTSLDLRREEGHLPSNKLNRRAFRANFDAYPSDRVTVRVSSAFSLTENDRPQNDNNIFGYLGNTLLTPITWYFTDSAAVRAIENKFRENRFVGSIEMIWSPIAQLELRGVMGYDGLDTRNDATYPPIYRYSGRVRGERNIYQLSRNQFNYDLSVRYSYTLPNQIRATTITGTQAFIVTQRTFWVTKQNFGSELVKNIGSGLDFINANEGFTNAREAGVFLQQEFNWQDKLFLSGGFRWDFASAYGRDAGDIFYPRADFSARLDQLGFLPGFFNLFNLFKARVAYGESGALPGLLDGQPLLWAPTPPSGYGVGLVVSRFGNTGIKPERTREVELGLDFEFRGGHGVELTYYRQYTSNSIVTFLLPPSGGTGVNSGGIPRNVGRIDGWGLETAAYANPIRTRNVQLSLNATFTWQDNKVKSLGGSSPIFDAFSFTVIDEGLRRNTFYVPKIKGPRYDNQGRFVGVELENNGERFDHGTPIPRYTGAVGMNLRLFRVLTLTANSRYALGHKVLNYTLAFTSRTGDFMNHREYLELRRKLGLSIGTNVPRELYENITPLTPGTPEYQQAAERYVRLLGTNEAVANYIEPGDFWKLDEVAISLDATSWLRRLTRFPGLRSFVITAAGRNLLIASKYRNPDPEVNFNGGITITNGQDFLTLPGPRVYTLGVRIGL
mgnify:FL=1